MILGLGLDLVEVKRVRRVLDRHGKRFCTRLLHEEEMSAYRAVAERPASAALFLAKRWAAKEASVKALGSGFGAGIDPRHILLYQLPGGRPALHCVQGTARLFAAFGVRRMHISISDERRYAVACVVLEGDAAAIPPDSRELFRA